jgi:uncharacterized DUF497 family protein
MKNLQKFNKHGLMLETIHAIFIEASFIFANCGKPKILEEYDNSR